MRSTPGPDQPAGDAARIRRIATDRGVFLGVDLGRRRTGTAIAHPPEWIVLPLVSLEAGTFAELYRQLAGLIAERRVAAVVFGLPLAPDGGRGGQALWCEKFGRYFRHRNRTPVFWQDERFSSAAAEQGARALGLKPSAGDPQKDTAEAAIILGDFLHRHGLIPWHPGP